MKERVFVDTGYWIALIDKRDHNNDSAKRSLRPLLCVLNPGGPVRPNVSISEGDSFDV